jgi:hypothetical protein
MWLYLKYTIKKLQRPNTFCRSLYNVVSLKLQYLWGCHGRDGMVVGFIITYAISA